MEAHSKPVSFEILETSIPEHILTKRTDTETVSRALGIVQEWGETLPPEALNLSSSVTVSVDTCQHCLGWRQEADKMNLERL